MENVEAGAAARGSYAVAEEVFGKPSEVSTQALKQLLSIARSQGVRLEGWWTHGKPAIDAVTGVLHVKPDVAGEIFAQLLKLERVPLKVEGFPLGVVTTELIELRFSTPGQG
jgi:hypothetical protein